MPGDAVKKLQQILGCRLRGLEGAVGRVREVLFDDRTWSIRHIVVAMGGAPWAPVLLLPPSLVDRVNLAEQCLEAPLLHREIMALPSGSTARPVSAQYEMAGAQPAWKTHRTPFSHGARLDPHLRGSQASIGYAIRAGEDFLGRLVDYWIDTEEWRIHALEAVDPEGESGAPLLIPAKEVERVSLAAMTISLRPVFPRHGGVVAA